MSQDHLPDNVRDLASFRARKLREQESKPLVVIFINDNRYGAAAYEPISRSHLIELLGWHAEGFEEDYYVANIPLGCWDYQEIKVGEEVTVFPLMRFYVGPK